MPPPQIAIVGRPNVGKSTLFNRIARQRISIVDPTPGVTRDRVSAIVTRDGCTFELVDTGGIGIVDRDDLGPAIEKQIEAAIRSSSVAVFLVDAREGLAAADRRVAERLRKLRKPVVVAANKCDAPKLDTEAAAFHALGFGDPVPVSATEGRGLDELFERLAPHLGETRAAEADPDFRLAVVGRRNVGKSTLVNALAHEERVIVSEVPGTTRDSIDVRIEKDGRSLVVVDTAGLRKRAAVEGTFEWYTLSRARAAVRRADVVFFVLDATLPIGQVEKQLADALYAQHRPTVVVVNKWDLVRKRAPERADTETFGRYYRKKLPVLAFAPIVFTTATEGKNIFAAVDLARALMKQSDARIPTARLNEVLADAMDRRPPPPSRNRVGRIYYATQASIRPPTIVLFVNDPVLFPGDHRRYLEGKIRDGGPFPEVPVRIQVRSRAGAAVRSARRRRNVAGEELEAPAGAGGMA
ncbi:MAG: ribosome biogenesis GTPase Der [Planctomycetales bacterium]|nr:ribosome biogenesis GTPase Der [Planctomycetales bacterium]